MKIRKISLVVTMALVISLVLLIPQVSYAVSFGGFVEDDFKRIDPGGGFGDPMNNYAWSMAYFNGDLYVGTGRNIPASIIQLIGMLMGEPYEPIGGIVTWPGFPDGELGDYQHAVDMTPEIWRYHCGEWDMVYQPDIVTIQTGPDEYLYLPQTGGYRVMTTFTDIHGVEAIYAGVGIMANSEPGQDPVLILRSNDGVNWYPVNTTSIAGEDIRGMVAHEGYLYVSGMYGPIYRTNDPQTLPGGDDTWEVVSTHLFIGPPPFNSPEYGNQEIPELYSFNGYLYASTYSAPNGFQVWRSNHTHPLHQLDWVKVVDVGYGDAANQGAITMQAFKDHLYVGSSIWLGFFPPWDIEQAQGFKGFDLIRIDTEDNVELVVGSYYPRVPTDPDPRETPISGWPAGFGNPLNAYCWQLEEHCGWLYLGTFDETTFLGIIGELIPLLSDSLLDPDMLPLIIEELLGTELPDQYMEELLTLLDGTDLDLAELIDLLWQYLGGADMWKSCDGINWIPVSLNGLDNPYNYGFRTLCSTPDGLYVGTANPFVGQGCEVWLGTKGTVVSTNEDGDEKFQFVPPEDVYVKGEGFPSCKNVTIYVIPDGLDPEPDNAVVPMGSPGETDICGKLPVTLVWSGPLDLGEYDVWVDVNQNGEHDNCDVYVAKALKCYMFFVIPESPLGAIVSVLTMIGALGVFALKKKRILAFK